MTSQLGSDAMSGGSILQMLLPEVLDVRAAGPLASAFISSRGHQMRVDAANVTSIGAQCLQIIVSARLTWERDGSTMTLVNPSEQFLDALSVAGLDMGSILEGKVDP